MTQKANKAKKKHIGTDGKPMSVWQIWLMRLCLFSIAWVCAEAVLGLVSLIFSFSAEELQWQGVPLNDALRSLGITSLIGSALNAFVAWLGLRGAKDPTKITFYFWVALANGVLCAWALVSAISNNAIDPASTVTCVFVIFMAVCAWNVRGQTGYFENHPHISDSEENASEANQERKRKTLETPPYSH